MSILRSPSDALLAANDLVVENASAHKRVEGDLDNVSVSYEVSSDSTTESMSQKGANEGDLDNVSVSYEVSSTTESMSQKGANQLGHLASVLRGRAVDVVHLSRLV